MSENNLIARNKFISKLNKKTNELAESLALLTKIDMKLLPLHQSGGAGLTNLGISIADLTARAELWKKAIDGTKGLNTKLKEVQTVIDHYTTLVNGLLTDIPPVVNEVDLGVFLQLDSQAMALATKLFNEIYKDKQFNQKMKEYIDFSTYLTNVKIYDKKLEQATQNKILDELNERANEAARVSNLAKP